MPKELNSYHYFELGDRCHVASLLIDASIVGHPALSDALRAKVEQAQELLGSVYQEAMSFGVAFDEQDVTVGLGTVIIDGKRDLSMSHAIASQITVEQTAKLLVPPPQNAGGKALTGVQRCAMSEFSMGDPRPLYLADLTRPFVFDREYGVFYCPAGTHRGAMALLLAWRHGLESGQDVARKFGLNYPDDVADLYLRTTHGTCFKSSTSPHILAGRLGNLSAIEARLLGSVEYLFD